MHIDESTRVPLSPASVLGLMASEGFQREKADRMSALEFSIEVTNRDSVPTVITTRTFYTGNLPEFIKPMLNPTMTVTETERWEPSGDGGCPTTGEFLIDVSGAPVSLRGRVDLEGDDGESVLRFTGELRTSVPLFRSKIEESAAESVIATMHTEFGLLHDHATGDSADRRPSGGQAATDK